MTARPPLSAAEIKVIRDQWHRYATDRGIPIDEWNTLGLSLHAEIPRLLDELERCRALLVNVLQGDPSRDPTADAWEYLDQAGVWTALRSRHPDAR